MDGCKSNPEKSSRTKADEHIAPRFPMSTILSLRDIKNKHNVYRGGDCIKKFCECLKKHARRIINFKKKKMKLLTNEQQESYEKAKICYICGIKFEDKYINDKKYH